MTVTTAAFLKTLSSSSSSSSSFASVQQLSFQSTFLKDEGNKNKGIATVFLINNQRQFLTVELYVLQQAHYFYKKTTIGSNPIHQPRRDLIFYSKTTTTTSEATNGLVTVHNRSVMIIKQLVFARFDCLCLYVVAAAAVVVVAAIIITVQVATTNCYY